MFEPMIAILWALGAYMMRSVYEPSVDMFDPHWTVRYTTYACWPLMIVVFIAQDICDLVREKFNGTH